MILLFLSTSLVNSKTIWNLERWRDGDSKQARMMDYSGFKPLDYFMVPRDRVMRTRAYMDVYALEDWSDYEEPEANYSGERTDIPVEEYIEHLVNNTPERALSGYQTYQVRGPKGQKNTGISGAIPRVNLQYKNFKAGAQTGDDIKHYVSLRSVAGLIYRDRFNCDTDVKHVKYNDDELEVRDSNGDLELVKDDDYCFFVYVPGVKTDQGEYGAFVGRANVNEGGITLSDDSIEVQHKSSSEIIESGLTPYLPLNEELRSRLENGQGDIKFRKGRYLVPQENGQIILPQNGANVMYNRREVERLYHAERHKKERTTSCACPLIVALIVGVVTFGIGAPLVWAVSAGLTAMILLPNESHSYTQRQFSTGIKGDFANRYPATAGPVYAYLALQHLNSADFKKIHDGEKDKAMTYLPIFLKDETERKMLEDLRLEAIPGSDSVNFGYDHQGVDIPVEFNQQIASGQWKSDVFPDSRWYQLMKIPAYNDGIPTSPGTIGTNEDITPCAEQRESVQELCTTKYGDFIEALNLHLGAHPIEAENGYEAYKGTDSRISLVKRELPVSAAYRDLHKLWVDHEQSLNELEQVLSDETGVLDADFRDFIFLTEEGNQLMGNFSKIQTLIGVLAKDYYQNEWFVNDLNAKVDLKTRWDDAVSCATESDEAARDACVDDKLGAATDDGVLKQYYAFEQYPTVARPFECFTSTDCNEIEQSDAKNVLGTLAMIEDILRPSAPSPKPYGKYMAEVDSCYDSGESMIDNLVCAQDSKIEAIRTGSAATPQNIEERWELD